MRNAEDQDSVVAQLRNGGRATDREQESPVGHIGVAITVTGNVIESTSEQYSRPI